MNRHRAGKAFTLIELLAVIAIIGVIAAIVAPNLDSFRKGDAMLSGTRQMLDAVARGRQLAISQRTTVYLVFVPPGFWRDPAFGSRYQPEDYVVATNLAGLQYIGYNYITLRTVGDQPGQGIPRYLSAWQTLPDGIFIAEDKFWNPARTVRRGRVPPPAGDDNWFVSTNYPGQPLGGFDIYGFEWATNLPFPRAETRSSAVGGRPWVALPYIAFDYLGRVVTQTPVGGDGEFIPLAHGGVAPARDLTTRQFAVGAGVAAATTSESPRLNSSNSFNLVHIDWLTGRARLEQREVR